ncbi:CPBP family intramembrane glutamic endopeptidase [Marinifilum sp. D737]|uniref:CPBP family intramembrane glutamic endopeptidase n=1 Tax=Marinifilum sp. D737 TaxID=2969628 RepID=UPI0022727D7C|nr:CPBP family intramembrane glutamic endopeptidase [Marinifilum sp. D737]MCY1636053.1 CPBP family intramembrane metalloprotease [Marinifilum sp. D737]
MTNNKPIPILPIGVRIILILISYVFVSGLFGLFGYLIVDGNLNNFSQPQNLSLKQNFICQGIGLIGTLLVVFVFRRCADLKSIVSMGFSLTNKVKDIVLGGLTAIFIICFGTVILVVFNQISIISIDFDRSDFIYGILLFATISLGEEVLCRGYILNNLMDTMNKKWALIITSCIFALLHSFNDNLNWLSILNLVLAGILLGSTYIYTKNIWYPISLHLFWNFIQACVFDYNVSGININSFVTFDISVKNIFNGGDFGFEGSILCTFLTVIAIILIHLLYRKKHVF